ncbi:hypothetical protein ABT150_05305 [Streptomyces mirabilis]|uniref:hypothetical protein n=1 Tax=Streptomyces mirabilis TaxID=68239 RepID=UPI003319CD67
MTSDARSGDAEPCDAPQESAAPSDTVDRMVELREVSQHTNVKLRTVAEMILVRGRRGDLPPDIRAALEDTLDKYGPTQIPDSHPAS